MGDSKYKVQEFVAHSTRVNCLSFGPKSNQVLATGGEDCKVNIWRVGNVSNIWTLGQNKSPIECLCFDADEQCVVSGTTNGSLKVFDLNVGKLARNLGSHPVGITSVQYHPYGEFIVSGSVDCTMKVWDVREKNCIQTYNGHSKEITCVRFSSDGKWVASASKDGQMQFWDLIAGKLVNSIKLNPVHVRTFEFSPADFTVAAATSMRTVRFWDLVSVLCPPMSSRGSTHPASASPFCAL
jgi:katanin p80 WD40 repeat-containing subunit B1